MTSRVRGSFQILSLIFLIFPAAAAAQKTDVVVLENGDQITGEIKSYSQGRLTLDTSHSSYVSVKWNRIRSITSDKQYDVETIDGVHHYGTLAATDPAGQLQIVAGPQTITVAFLDVFGLAPVRRRFWLRWEGSLDLGFTYTKASNLVQFNLGADATYRVRDYQVVADLSSFYSRQDDVTAAERGSFTAYYDRFIGKRWFAEGGVGSTATSSSA